MEQQNSKSVKPKVLDLSKRDVSSLSESVEGEYERHKKRIQTYGELCEAVITKNISAIKDALIKCDNHGVDLSKQFEQIPNQKGSKVYYAKGKHFLHYDYEYYLYNGLPLACYVSDAAEIEIFDILIKKMPKFLVHTYSRPSVLHMLLEKEKVDIAIWLLNALNKNEIGELLRFSYSPSLAVLSYRKGWKDLFNLLLDKGYPVEFPVFHSLSGNSSHFDTLLGVSIEKNDWKLFKRLVNNPQVYISSVRQAGYHMACGRSGMVLNGYYLSAIHLCAYYNRIDMLKELIIKGVDIDGQTYRDFSSKALHIACEMKHEEIIKYLLANGIDYRIMDINGKTASELSGVSEEIKEMIVNGPFNGIKEYVVIPEVGEPKEYVNYSNSELKGNRRNLRVKALVRLLRDYKEILAEPFSTIKVFPLENDFFTWHTIFAVPVDKSARYHPFRGVQFHLTFTFPDDYPHNPPKLRLDTSIPHPNVFSSYICLDMLQQERYSKNYYNGGWTTAYTAYAILMQVQAFLFDENIPQETYGSEDKTIANKVYAFNSKRTFAIEDVRAYKCTHCGYNIKFKAVNEKEVSLQSSLGFSKFLSKINAKKAALNEIAEDVKKKKKRIRRKNKKSTAAPSKPVVVSEKRTPIEEHQPTLISISNWNQKINKLSSQPAKVVVNMKSVNGKSNIEKLPGDLIAIILDFLTKPRDLATVILVSKRFLEISKKFHIWKRRELICFFSKKNFREEVLGVGVHVERHKSNQGLKTLQSTFDLLSQTAFYYDNIRESVWKEKFEYWIPVLLDNKHSVNAIPLLRTTVTALVKNEIFEGSVDVNSYYGRYDKYGRLYKSQLTSKEVREKKEKIKRLDEEFDPLMMLQVFPKLVRIGEIISDDQMNHMVVAFMKEDNNGKVDLHASEKALLGYCGFHHILLKFANMYPVIQQKVDFLLSEFLSHESKRAKLVTPDLGELLVLLSLASTVTWEQISEVFLQEFFDRLVLWMLDKDSGKHGELAYIEKDEISDYRLSNSFQASKTSLRLLMFQVFFLRRVGRIPNSSLNQILENYAFSYGYPPAGAAQNLQRACFDIHKCNTWEEFYIRIGIKPPTKPQMTLILKNAVIRSESKGYHKNRSDVNELFEWRKKLEPTVDNAFNKNAFPEVSGKEEIEKQEISNEVLAPVEVPKENSKEQRRSYKLFVRNFSNKVTDEILAGAFRQFGSFVKATVVKDEGGRSRGFGFVEFSDETAAETAIKYANSRDGNADIVIEKVRAKGDIKAPNRQKKTPNKEHSVRNSRRNNKEEKPLIPRRRTTIRNNTMEEEKSAVSIENPFSLLSD